METNISAERAAGLLNVSVPYLEKLLADGSIPTRGNGPERIRLEDLLAYKRDFLARRHAALDELAALSQELGLGY